LMMGVFRPQFHILGQEVAGVVEAVGRDVESFRPGDPVFAVAHKFGAYAEYICLPASDPIAIKPDNMSFEEAVTLPTGTYNALHFLGKASIRKGETILINGAGGGIGTIAIQLAKYFGAEVTAVDSAGKLEMLRSIGADHVVDYMRQDFTSAGNTYDIIFDVHGSTSFSRCVDCLNPKGRYVLANPKLLSILRGFWLSGTSDKKVIAAFAGARTRDLEFIRSLVEAGDIKSVIDRVYPLKKIVEAHAYVETGLKKGNVVVSVARDAETRA